MGKSKREIKKELKKEMKGKMKTKLKVKVKKKMKKFKLIFIILSTIAAIVAFVKVIQMLFEKKMAKCPEGKNLKQVFSLFASTKETFVDKITGGVMLDGFFSTVKADFSGCEFEDGTFIAVKSGLAYVNIIMPENVNIKFDSIDVFTFIKQEYDTEHVDETLPTVYIALKGVCSSVIISRGITVPSEAEAEASETEAAEA